MAGSTESAPASTGKTFSFNLTGEDFHLYESLRSIYEGEQEARDERRQALLDAMDPADRALFASAVAATSTEKMSYRQFFARAMQDAMSHQEALADAEEAGSEEEVEEAA